MITVKKGLTTLTDVAIPENATIAGVKELYGPALQLGESVSALIDGDAVSDNDVVSYGDVISFEAQACSKA